MLNVDAIAGQSLEPIPGHIFLNVSRNRDTFDYCSILLFILLLSRLWLLLLKVKRKTQSCSLQ